MATINLRKYYPELYTVDEDMNVPDAVAALLEETRKSEHAALRRMYWNKAHYSLDRGDGIEHDALQKPKPPWAEYEDKLTATELHKAFLRLPSKQLRRLYAYYYLGMSMTDIAAEEGVHRSRISKSIRKALDNLLNYVRYPF